MAGEGEGPVIGHATAKDFLTAAHPLEGSEATNRRSTPANSPSPSPTEDEMTTLSLAPASFANRAASAWPILTAVVLALGIALALINLA